VFTSSIAIYGTSPELPMSEETTPHPEDPYGIAKLAVEQELRVCKEMFDLNYIIFRPHNVYGERQNIGDKYRNVVGIFMNQILQDKPMTIFGNGEQSRAFSYISDVAPIIAESICVPQAYNQIFNIGADQPYTVNQLAQAVARAMGEEPNIMHISARNEVMHAYSSHDKVRCVFGERKLYSLEDGLCRMARWVKRHGSRTSQKFKDIEITKNFPQAWLS
jgi:UDP-glucose 4-epimerase